MTAQMTQKWQNTHFISMKMSQFITLIALLLCRRSPYTLACGWVGCAFLDCLWKCHRRQKEKRRGGNSAGVDIDLPFILLHYCMTHTFATGRVRALGAHMSACAAVSCTNCTYVYLVLCVHLTWFVAQYVCMHVSNLLWEAFFFF